MKCECRGEGLSLLLSPAFFEPDVSPMSSDGMSLLPSLAFFEPDVSPRSSDNGLPELSSPLNSVGSGCNADFAISAGLQSGG